MILTRHSALKAALLTTAIAMAAAFSVPAQAEHRYGGGFERGFSASWHDRGHAQGRRGFLRDYGWYAPGQYYNRVDHRPLRAAHDRGRVWCPTRRAYIVDHHDDPWYDDGNFYDVWDDRDNWPDEYYERDRQYRRW